MLHFPDPCISWCYSLCSMESNQWAINASFWGRGTLSVETTIHLFGATPLNHGESNLCARLTQRFFCHRVRVEVTIIQYKQPSRRPLFLYQTPLVARPRFFNRPHWQRAFEKATSSTRTTPRPAEHSLCLRKWEKSNNCRQAELRWNQHQPTNRCLIRH